MADVAGGGGQRGRRLQLDRAVRPEGHSGAGHRQVERGSGENPRYARRQGALRGRRRGYHPLERGGVGRAREAGGGALPRDRPEGEYPAGLSRPSQGHKGGNARPFAEGFLGRADLRRHRRRICASCAGVSAGRHASHGAGPVSDSRRRATCRARGDHGAARVRSRRPAGAAVRSTSDPRVAPGHRAVRHRAAMGRACCRRRGARAHRRQRHARRAHAGRPRTCSSDGRLLGRSVRVAARAAAAALAHFVSRACSHRRTQLGRAREAAMETLSNLAFGLGVALSWQNILYCFIGCFLGTLVGVLPGIGPVATVAMLLPFTFGLGPAPALIMLAGIYYGAQYGGSTTAILVNIPGESSSVVTTLDGHQMARRGRAGPALGIAAIGSFIAGCIATLLIAYFAPPLAEVALKFSPAEYFSLMVFGLIAAVVLARGSLIKAIAMVCFGILLGLLGTDVNSGVIRFAFGQAELADGLGFVALAMAFFGITDVVLNLEHKEKQQVFTSRIGSVLPTRADLRTCFWSIVRGTSLGSLLGVLPGGGALLASFAAYMVEKKVAKPPRA